MKAQYPQALVIEVKKDSLGQPIDSNTCNQWISDFSISHLLLRDDGQVKTNLSMITYDILVLDRYLKIAYRGQDAWSSATKSAVLSTLSTLK